MKKFQNSKRLTLVVCAISFYFVAFFLWQILLNKVAVASLSDSELLFNLFWVALLIVTGLNYRRLVKV